MLHLIDISEENLIENYNQVRNELKAYSTTMLKKDEKIVLNKVDLIDKKKLSEKIEFFQNNTGKKVLTLSTLDKNLIKSIKSNLIKYVSWYFKNSCC